MSASDRSKWDQIYRDKPTSTPRPAQVLVDYAHLLPDQGLALDLACGRGGNAMFLADRGLDTHAWDISKEALNGLANQDPRIHTHLFDAEQAPLPSQRFDVICVSHYLHRPLFASLKRALRPGGLIYYQTFIRDKVQAVGPSRNDYLLKTNELLHAFDGLIVRAYREEGSLGQCDQGFRNQAMIVAQRSNAADKPDLG